MLLSFILRVLREKGPRNLRGNDTPILKMIQALADNEALLVNTLLLLETFELDVWERLRNAVLRVPEGRSVASV